MPKPKNTKAFHAFVARGAEKGKLLYPHVHEDGMYVVSLTRFERDYMRVANENDLEGWMVEGYRLRMSNLAEQIKAPSLIVATKIYRPVAR